MYFTYIHLVCGNHNVFTLGQTFVKGPVPGSEHRQFSVHSIHSYDAILPLIWMVKNIVNEALICQT